MCDAHVLTMLYRLLGRPCCPASDPYDMIVSIDCSLVTYLIPLCRCDQIRWWWTWTWMHNSTTIRSRRQLTSLFLRLYACISSKWFWQNKAGSGYLSLKQILKNKTKANFIMSNTCLASMTRFEKAHYNWGNEYLDPGSRVITSKLISRLVLRLVTAISLHQLHHQACWLWPVTLVTMIRLMY